MIVGQGATGNWVYGNVIGTDTSGTAAAGNQAGVAILDGAHGNVVGLPAGSTDARQANLIGGNTRAGVVIDNGLGFDPSSTSSLNTLALNGDASIVDGQLQLTDRNALLPVASSAFSAEPRGITQFSTSFEFSTQNAATDGITFTIQGMSPYAMGLPGTNLGYGWLAPGGGPGIDRSVAIKFATERASGGQVSSTGLYVDGAAPTSPQLDLAGTGIDLSQDDTFRVDATYDGATLRVTITDESTGAAATQSYAIDILRVVGGTTAYVGFTAGSLPLNRFLQPVAAIQSWTFSPADRTTRADLVAGNRIGTDASGQAGLANGIGVLIAGGATQNTVGGTTASAGNTIANNLQSGVVVTDATSVGDAIIANILSGNNASGSTSEAQGIDLGGDGDTPNAAGPRQGPNDLQNFPVIVATPLGYQGWLSGSLAGTTYRVDVYAGLDYAADGSTQARAYLGSVNVTTDASGQAAFVIPFAPPAGLPILTATATDPQGDTSELTPLRTALNFSLPGPIVRDAPDTLLVFSNANGTALSLVDPLAGPLDAVMELTLSVGLGTLRLTSTVGLVGTGDGTGSLTYRGTVAALNAVLAGLTFGPPPNVLGDIVLSLEAKEYGAVTARSQLTIRDGYHIVTNVDDSGPGSLRQAVEESGLDPGINVIDFAIDGTGIQTITLGSPLTIVGPLLIDGFSQPGYVGTPLIRLAAQSADVADGLIITGAGSTVRGLQIVGFLGGAGILITGPAATGNLITANVLGSGPAAAPSEADAYGVQITDGASNNTIGGDGAAAGNTIAGNAESGVDIEGPSIGNRVQSDLIYGNNTRGGLGFSGTVQSVDLGNPDALNFSGAITLEAWVKLDSTGTPGHLQDIIIHGWQNIPYDQGVGLVLEGTSYSTFLYNYAGLAEATFPIPETDVGKWVFLAAVWDPNSSNYGAWLLYRNGVLVAQFGWSIGSTPVSSTDWAIGARGTGTDEFFQGAVADAAIWNVTRGADQILADMTNGLTGTEPGLQAYYPLNDVKGSTALDHGPNGLDGTLEPGGAPRRLSSTNPRASTLAPRDQASARHSRALIKTNPHPSSLSRRGGSKAGSPSPCPTRLTGSTSTRARASGSTARARPRSIWVRWMSRPTRAARPSSRSRSPRRPAGRRSRRRRPTRGATRRASPANVPRRP